MGILEELEKAHIYIERLNETLKEKEAAIDQLDAKLQAKGTQLAEVRGETAAFAKRLARLEAVLLHNEPPQTKLPQPPIPPTFYIGKLE